MDEVKNFTAKNVVQTILSIPNTLKLIFKLEKKFALQLLFLNCISALIPLATLYIYQALINSVIGSWHTIIFFLCCYFVLQIVSTILGQVESFVSEKFQMRLSYSINLNLMQVTSSLELSDYEQSDMYNLIEKVTQDSNYKPFQLFNAIISTMSALISLSTSLFFIGTWNMYVALILLVIPLLSLTIFLRVGQIEFLIQWQRSGTERTAWYLIYLLTHDFSFKEIKLNNSSSYLIHMFSKIKKKFIYQDINIAKKKAWFNTLLGVMLNVINSITIVLIILSVKVGEIMFGNLVSLIQALSKLNDYSQTVIQNIYVIYNTSLFMTQLFNFLNKKDIANKSNETEKFSSIENVNKIVLKNVMFNYPNSEFNALNDINITIERGSLTAIVGKNGSGKTTLLKLLSGLYKPSSGEMYFNNVSTSNLNMKDYQNRVSVLFQDFVKYELTLKDNVRLSSVHSNNTDQQIKMILDSLNMSFLKPKDDYDLDLQLGNWFNDGQQLSGGQWQKIALSRTFYKNADVYILDEPNSALDPTAEKELFKYFVKLSKSKITMFISHNIKAAQRADQIIVMKEGQVIDVGKHTELLQRCPYYKELFESEKYQDVV
ncbi:Subtilin transport ATP-binding protein spaT [Leuconostoc gelidum subsp. gasicomitatum]|nr:Subtilin transport ATP-binding protein spaT [Leuconostoc gasicomitatum]